MIGELPPVRIRGRFMTVVLCAAMAGGTGGLLPATPALAGTPSRGQTTAVTGAKSWPVQAATVANPFANTEGPPTGTSALPRPSACRAPAPAAPSGEGILSLTLAAPRTIWASATDTAVTVEARVDGGAAQQIVLFAGASPFTYQGFVGSLATGAHCVTVAVRPDLSHVTTTPATIDVSGISLGVVPFSSTDYVLESHAPVLYGRSTSAVGDTPLLTYGTSAPDPDGSDTDLSYTVVWTHEDTGDGTVPAYEWGLWGRMTDIETVLSEKVAADGRILTASYLSCGCESAPAYPDAVPEDPAAGGETDKPYPATGTPPPLGRHLVLRDATGNNDISPYGTSAYRFQQTLVPAPRRGQAREVAMDNNPWTYRISGEEVARECPSSSDPRSLLAGDYPQYLIVDIDAASTGTSSIAAEVRIGADPTWYSDDYAQMTAPGPPSTFPFYNGGHARTVIKLPAGWNGTPISALRLRLNAPLGSAPQLVGSPVIDLVEVTPAYEVLHPPFPAPTITSGPQLFPTGVVGV